MQAVLVEDVHRHPPELDQATTMAEDQCLIQYFRDNFGQEFTHNYVNLGDDDDTSYGFDYNGFAESSTFADDPSSPVTTLAPDLFGSPSSPSAMEGTPYLETATDSFSPPGEAGLQIPSVLSNLHLDRPLQSENEYPMLASYGPSQACPPELQAPLESQGFEGITLDEILQDQFAASCKSSSSATDGERATSSWRGKSPALLMQQLKGPSLSALSSSSEARSNLRFPSFQQSPSAQSPTTLAPRAPASMTSFCNRVGEINSHHTFGLLEPLPMSALGFSRQRSLSPLENTNIDVKFKNILSPGSSLGHGVLQSSGSFEGDGELMQSNIKQRRKIMPGLANLGEIQRNAASGNNSWSSSSTSPGPSSRVHHDREFLAANFDLIMRKNNCNASVSPAMSLDRDVGGHRVWKKAKAGELRGCAVSEDAVQAAILATAMVEQKEKNQLQEKFLALLQIDSATSKDYKAQILDDTIRYLKDVRRRLDFNEADSAPNSKRIPESGFPADKSTDASPTTSSRCRLNSEGFPSCEGFPSSLRLKDLELETEGVEISPHLSVDGGPHIEVRMMENQHVMVKLIAKDRPGFFSDIVVALRSLKLDIQHANIRTGNNGQRHDIFAAKMQLPLFSIQSTHSIAMALNQVISASGTPLASPELLPPQI